VPTGGLKATGASMDRRAFLAGAVGLTALAVGVGWRQQSDSDAGGTDHLVPSTVALLARPRITAPRGDFRTEYGEAAPGPDKTYDFRLARFSSYHDKDAVYETGPFTSGSTEHQKNHRPIRLGYESPAAGLAIVGGRVEGDQPISLPWVRMKYGQQVQDDTDAWIDAGSPDAEDPYRNVEDNANQDGDPRIYVRSGGWAVVDGLRVRNTHDGLGLFGQSGSDGAGTVHIRNCYFQDIHDDAIENDEWQELHVHDCLFERVYCLLSQRPSQQLLLDRDQSSRVATLDRCVAQMWPFPGGHKKRSTDRNHERVFKMDTNSPRVVVRNSVLMVERYISDEATRLPERSTSRGDRVNDVYENVMIIWAGDGNYPGNVPSGCTVSKDTGLFDRAAAEWKRRHRNLSFDSPDSDMTQPYGPK